MSHSVISPDPGARMAALPSPTAGIIYQGKGGPLTGGFQRVPDSALTVPDRYLAAVGKLNNTLDSCQISSSYLRGKG